MNTELRAKAYTKLVDLIEIMSDDMYIKKIYNDKVYYIAYVGIEGFRSCLIGGRDKIYLFIEEDLTEQERIKELDYVFNGNMDYFDNEEIERIKEISNKQKAREIQLKLINNEDAEVIVAHATLGEYRQVYELNNELNKFLNSTNRDWDNISKMLYMFRLGIMQGKREERARRGSRIVNGKDTN